MESLYKKLAAYGASDFYAFHMPGHKRNPEFTEAYMPYGIDITEIDGFDDLHHAEGILKDMQERASRLFHSGETHFLINGSTVGILSAISGVTKPGDKILLARNCHKSVYHAVYMNGLCPVYVYPEFLRKEGIGGETNAGEIKRILCTEPGIKAVVIVSPTYDGVVSDIKNIAEAVHEKGLPLIVDEAHGAHFGFGEGFPDNANVLGADIVIHSLHKTLPSMTQTALLHINGTIVNRGRVRKYLHMLQSSSPSYVLMASMDACMELLENRGEELFRGFSERLENFRKDMDGLQNLRLVRTDHFDPSKLLISTADTYLSGRDLHRVLLETYHLQMEMQADSYVLAMTSICDTAEGFERLKKALYEIDQGTGPVLPESHLYSLHGTGQKGLHSGTEIPRPDVLYGIREAEERAEITGTEYLEWEESCGRTAAEYAYLYPPGIPFLVPGERIDKAVMEGILHYLDMGFAIEGPLKERKIEVLKEKRM